MMNNDEGVFLTCIDELLENGEIATDDDVFMHMLQSSMEFPYHVMESVTEDEK